MLPTEVSGDFDVEEEDEEGGEEGESLKTEKEGKFMRELQDPRLPSEEEVEKHKKMGHIGFRSWCEVYVQSEAKDNPHRKDQGKERLVPEYSWDFCFPEMTWDLSGPYWWDKKG